MTNNGTLKHHPDAGGYNKRHRQRNDRVERQPLWGEPGHHLLNHPGGIRAQHQHLPVGHVNHPQQAVGNCQPQRGEQQYRPQRESHKRLTKQIAPHQAMLNQFQTFGSGGTHASIRLRCCLRIRRQPGLNVRIV